MPGGPVTATSVGRPAAASAQRRVHGLDGRFPPDVLGRLRASERDREGHRPPIRGERVGRLAPMNNGDGQLFIDQLEDILGPGEASELMCAARNQPSVGGQLFDDQGGGCRGHHRLAAAGQTPEPCGPVDRWSVVVAVTHLGASRVQRRPDSQIDAIGPVRLRERAVDGDDHGGGAVGLGEDRQRAVALALGAGKAAAVLVHEVGDDVAEKGHRRLHGFRMGLPLRRRLFDVGEAERQLARRQIGLVRVLESLDQLTRRSRPAGGSGSSPRRSASLCHLGQRGVDAVPPARIGDVRDAGQQGEPGCREPVDVRRRRRRDSIGDLGRHPRAAPRSRWAPMPALTRNTRPSLARTRCAGQTEPWRTEATGGGGGRGSPPPRSATAARRTAADRDRPARRACGPAMCPRPSPARARAARRRRSRRESLAGAGWGTSASSVCARSSSCWRSAADPTGSHAEPDEPPVLMVDRTEGLVLGLAAQRLHRLVASSEQSVVRTHGDHVRPEQKFECPRSCPDAIRGAPIAFGGCRSRTSPGNRRC